MAITIRARQGTTIGYKGTSGGSVNWINQAGKVGNAAANLGSQITSSASSIRDLFDKDMDASELQQQKDEMQVKYLTQSKNLASTIREGGFLLDDQGVPTEEYDPKSYTRITDNFHDKFWKEQIEGQGYNEKAVASFGVYFGNKANESYANADKFAVTRRYANLITKDDSTYKGHMAVIASTPLVKDKEDAFNAIMDIGTSGAPHIDSTRWLPLMSDAKNAFAKHSAIANAYGQQGRKADPNDLVNGYTSQDYRTAIERIKADQTIGKQKPGILTAMKANLEGRLKAEKTAKSISDNDQFLEFGRLKQENKLTPEMILNTHFDDFKQQQYWLNQLKEDGNEPWKRTVEEIMSSIQTGSFTEPNDVARTPNVIRESVRRMGFEKGVPADEVGKLMAYVNTIAAAAPETAKMSAAVTHAKSMFSTKSADLFSMMSAGRESGNKMAESIDRANANKIWKFRIELDKQLKDGRKNGLTWNQMLNPSKANEGDYIVNNIIDDINKTEPDRIAEEIKVDPSWASQLNEFVTGIFSSDETQVKVDSKGVVEVDDQGDAIVESVGVTHEVYGSSSVYKTGVTAEQAKAQIDSQYAKETLDDVAARIVYPEGHPGYSQFTDGVETYEHWKERKRIMGYK